MFKPLTHSLQLESFFTMVIEKSSQRANSNLQVIWKGCLDFCVTILLISSKILPSVFVILMKISPKMPKLDVNFVG